MTTQKVYVIEETRPSASRRSAPATGGDRSTRGSGRRDTETPRGDKSWPIALRAYILGPVNLVLWPGGKRRAAWAIVGAVAMVAVACLWIWWQPFSEIAARDGRGAVLWASSVALAVLLLATAWARAVAASAPVRRWPRLLRRSIVVCAAGLALPGLGLLVAGRPSRSAAAVWFLGLTAAAIMVARQWLEIAPLVSGGTDGLTARTFEGVLMVAAGCMVVGAMAWLVQALDGLRLSSAVRRSSTTADGLALALVVSLTVLVATYRPTALASDLESAAVKLHSHGLRIIPLVLYESASRLDPGTPAYLAGAAQLHDELGSSETADARRELLRERAARFAETIDAELVPVTPRDETRPWETWPPDRLDRILPPALWLIGGSPEQTTRADGPTG